MAVQQVSIQATAQLTFAANFCPLRLEPIEFAAGHLSALGHLSHQQPPDRGQQQLRV